MTAKRLSRKQLTYARQRAQDVSIAASARVAGCAESTAHLWERLPEVVTEITALRAAVVVTSPSDDGSTVDEKSDLEAMLRHSIAECRRHGDHRTIATLVDKLRLVLEGRRTSSLAEQIRSADVDELVDALQRGVGENTHVWVRLDELTREHMPSSKAVTDWRDALAMSLSGMWMRDAHRETWWSRISALLDLAGALVKHPDIPGIDRSHVRQAVADARVALDHLDTIYASPTDAAETEPAPTK